MKNLLITAFIVLTFIAGVNAQGRFSMKDRIQEMKDSLALSDSQTVAITAIYTTAGEKMKSIDATGQERRQAMHQIMDDVNTQVENILTPEQKVKYEAMMAERRSRMRSGSQRDSGNKPPDNNQ